MRKTWFVRATVGAVLVLAGARLAAQPINPQVYKKQFEEARKDAEVVVKARAVAATCSAVDGAGKAKMVTLQVALQVLDSDKGPLKKNDVVVITHKVQLPAGPGPGSYGYMGAIRRFPFTPGVEGDVALRWDKEARAYTVIAGWVETPNGNPTAIPTEVGKTIVAGDMAPK
jgi:hypothetical protein